MAEEEQLTVEEKEELQKLLGSPYPDEKHTVHTFLHRIATAKDTTKTGFLGDTELGQAEVTVRGNLADSWFAENVMHCSGYAKFLKGEAETILASSLSRDGFLVKMGITTTRQIADITKVKAEKKGGLFGLFGKKKEPEGGNNQ